MVLPNTIEQSSRGRFETAERALLQPVGERAGQQIAVDSGRRIFAIHRSPTIFEMLNIEGGECSEFALEVIPVGRVREIFHKLPAPSPVAHTHCSFPRTQPVRSIRQRFAGSRDAKGSVIWLPLG